MCPAVAHICHRLHYVQINHINNFFIINPINRLNDFKISLLRYVPQPRTYPSAYSLCCGCLNVIGWFRSTSPDAEVISALPLRYNDSFDMCPKRSIAHIRHIHFLMCPSSYISSGCFDQPSFRL